MQGHAAFTWNIKPMSAAADGVAPGSEQDNRLPLPLVYEVIQRRRRQSLPVRGVLNDLDVIACEESFRNGNKRAHDVPLVTTLVGVVFTRLIYVSCHDAPCQSKKSRRAHHQTVCPCREPCWEIRHVAPADS